MYFEPVDDVHAGTGRQVDVGLGEAAILGARRPRVAQAGVTRRLRCGGVERSDRVASDDMRAEPEQFRILGEELGHRLTRLHTPEVLECNPFGSHMGVISHDPWMLSASGQSSVGVSRGTPTCRSVLVVGETLLRRSVPRQLEIVSAAGFGCGGGARRLRGDVSAK